MARNPWNGCALILPITQGWTRGLDVDELRWVGNRNAFCRWVLSGGDPDKYYETFWTDTGYDDHPEVQLPASDPELYQNYRKALLNYTTSPWYPRDLEV